MAWAEPAAGPKTLPVFGHVQSQCTNIMSESRQQEHALAVAHSLQADTVHPLCRLPNSRDRQRCRACVLDTRLSAYNGHVEKPKGLGWSKGCMQSTTRCGWCVACTQRQKERQRERDRDSDSLRFHIFADCIPRPTYSPCLSHSRGWRGGEWASALPRAAGRLRAAPY